MNGDFLFITNICFLFNAAFLNSSITVSWNFNTAFFIYNESNYLRKCRFPMLFVIPFRSFYIYPDNRKPVEPKFYGHLVFYTTLSCDNKSIFRLYYSMIVATRPEPTVRPTFTDSECKTLLHSYWMNHYRLSSLRYHQAYIYCLSKLVELPVTSTLFWK